MRGTSTASGMQQVSRDTWTPPRPAHAHHTREGCSVERKMGSYVLRERAALHVVLTTCSRELFQGSSSHKEPFLTFFITLSNGIISLVLLQLQEPLLGQHHNYLLASHAVPLIVPLLRISNVREIPGF